MSENALHDLALEAIEARDQRARTINDVGSPIMCAQDRRDLLAEVRQLRGQRDAARGEVMGELLDAKRRAEQAEAEVKQLRCELTIARAEAEAAVARVRELIDPATEMAALPYGEGNGRYFEEADIRRALDGGETP